MPEQTYGRIAYRVYLSVPDWKSWPRRLRRIYASLEDWGSSEEAVQDMVEQWGWDWESILKLSNATQSFRDALETFREDGEYPKGRKHWALPITTSQLKAVYIREGELTSFASLDENPKAITHHQRVVYENDMLGLAEAYPARDDIGGMNNETGGDSGSGLQQFAFEEDS